MKSYLALFLLGLIQGLTEFLPVSSSGHLTLVQQLFGVEGNLMLINLFLHLATLVAVIVVYRKTILNLFKKPFQPLTYKLIISTIFTCILAFIYEYFNIDNLTFKIYCFGFLTTSILLLLLDLYKKRVAVLKSDKITYKDSVIVGIVQGLAVIPGLSRSGSTIAALTFCGNNEQDSAEYSFLLSIPIIVGGFIIEVVKMPKNIINLDFYTIGGCVFAFLLTFVVAMFALKLTIRFLKKNKFVYFSVYTFILFLIAFIINFLI